MKHRRPHANNRRFQDLPDMCTPEEARAFLRLSRNAMYAQLREQRIASLRFGRLIRIPKSALVA